MAGRIIQGFFIGGRMPVPPGRPVAFVAQRVAHPGARSAPARRAMPGPPPPLHAHPAAAQRFGGGGDSFPIDPAQIGLVRGGGSPLPQAVLAKMEAAFGADFSKVRVHVGSQAARIGAVAFTMGDDLYFAPGQFQPESVKGQQLIGHELAHVIQQRQGRVRAPGSGVSVVQDRALEAEADRLGMRAAAHQPRHAGSVGRAGAAVQRSGAPARPANIAPTPASRLYSPHRRPTAHSTGRAVAQAMMTTYTGGSQVSTVGFTPISTFSPAMLFPVSSPTCLLTPEAELQRLDHELIAAKLIPGFSREKLYLIERLENEQRILERELLSGFRPKKGTPIFSNAGYWKDWINDPLRSYPTNPTKISGVSILDNAKSQKLIDGYYAYAWRESDNLIAIVYSGENGAMNNPVAHSYLASGGDVYAAGVFVVKSGKIISANNASGHYKPDSGSSWIDKDCLHHTTEPPSVQLFAKKLKTLGYPNVLVHAFSSPDTQQKVIDCGMQKWNNRF